MSEIALFEQKEIAGFGRMKSGISRWWMCIT